MNTASANPAYRPAAATRETLAAGADGLLARAAAGGADAAQVVGVHTVTTRIGFEKNDFNIAKRNQQTTFDLTVHKDWRRGTAATNEVTPDAIAATAGTALTLARFSVDDRHLRLPDPATADPLPGRFDGALDTLPIASLRELASAFIETARAEPRLSLDNAGLELTTRVRWIANSKGLRASDATTTLEWDLMGMGKTDGELTSFDVSHGGTFCWQGAEQACCAAARAFVHKLMDCFNARRGPTYRGPVVLSPAAVGDLLLSPIQYHVSGRQIMDGKSRWAAALGKQVAAAPFTLIDDPFDLGLLGATPFDAEGVPVRRQPIIEQGVLRTHIDSTYTANRRGTRSTGHAGGLHGIRVEPGEQTLPELLAAVECTVVVERFSGNVDRVTGDFSGVAKGSHAYRRGAQRQALRETMIAGNFFEILRGMQAASRDAAPYCNLWRAPYVLVDGVSVTSR